MSPGDVFVPRCVCSTFGNGYYQEIFLSASVIFICEAKDLPGASEMFEFDPEDLGCATYVDLEFDRYEADASQWHKVIVLPTTGRVVSMTIKKESDQQL